MTNLIGQFTQNDQGFSGNIRTLQLNLSVRLEPLRKESDKSPDWEILCEKHRVGVAWTQTTERGSRYYRLKLDDPSFPHLLSARLVAKKDQANTFLLLWERS
jgi:uncharacterized protein (DUF736 family)